MFPVKDDLQPHVNSVPLEIHVPSFKHGWPSHGSAIGSFVAKKKSGKRMLIHVD